MKNFQTDPVMYGLKKWRKSKLDTVFTSRLDFFFLFFSASYVLVQFPLISKLQVFVPSGGTNTAVGAGG